MSEAAEKEPPSEAGTADLPQETQLARSVVIIGLSLASFLLGTLQLFLAESAEQFLLGNQVAIKLRLVSVGISWLVGLIAAAGIVFVTRESGKHRAIATLVAPLAVTSFVPVLFVKSAWEGREIAFLALALAVGLALERLLRPALEIARDWSLVERISKELRADAVHKVVRWLPLALTLSLVAFYVLRIGHLSNVSHMKLHTSSSDLAEYDNMFFNALSGHPFRSPAIAGHMEDWSTLQGHAEFGLYFLLPFYAISPGSHALLWIQSALVGLTAIPLYLLGASRLGKFTGVAFAFAFLAAPATQQPNFYDFHFTPLGMFWVSWIIYFVYRLVQNPDDKKFRVVTFVTLGFALLTREDISIGVAVLGTYLILSGKLVKDGFRLAAIAAGYFVFMKFVFMPLFGIWWFDNMYEDIKAPGAKGFGAVVLTMISNPSFLLRTMMTEPKLLYILHMGVPFLALWFRRPLLLLAFLPGFVQTLLATNRPPLYQASFQYTYLWLPYVAAASMVAVKKKHQLASAVALLLVSLSLSSHFGVYPTGDKIKGGFGMKTFEFSPAEQKQYQALTELIEMIPKDASVSATEAEGPHVSNRVTMFSLKYTLGHSPEYLLISHPRHRGEQAHVRKALESGEYGVIARKGRFTLMKRGASTKDNGSMWRKVGGRARPKAGARKKRSRKNRARVIPGKKAPAKKLQSPKKTAPAEQDGKK